jgi:lipoprotein-anchoring transpeptidase ErfK/SrfK
VTVNGRYRRLAVVAASAAAALLTACSGGGSPAAQHSTGAGSSTGSASASAPGSASTAPSPSAAAVSPLKIFPASGTRDASPSGGITVTAVSGGQVSAVSVRTSSSHPVTGTLAGGGASWHSSYALPTAASYTVTATGKDAAGQPVTTTSSFTTLNPAQAFHTQIFEGADQTYGVGMPVLLTFDRPITNKAAVEKALTLKTSKPVVGAWYWDGSERLDFRPRDYWPAGTAVSLSSHLDGVEGAPGVYGVHDLSQTFKIGTSVIAVADTSTHKTKIYVGGKLKYTWPISSGKEVTPTPNGTYLTVEKGNPVRMTGGGAKGSAGYYNELVNYAVRFTFSGDYYHSAPWSVVNQGVSNVSHGCVNLAPEDAKIYYDMAIPGDPVTITSSTRAGNWDNGWTDWFLSWSQLVAGSATHLAVSAGPGGSSFVSTGTASVSHATSPVGTSSTGNYFAVK